MFQLSAYVYISYLWWYGLSVSLECEKESSIFHPNATTYQ